MRVKHISIAAVVLSVLILAVISSAFHVDPRVLLQIQLAFLAAATLSAILRLLAQGLRFNYIVRSFSGREFPFWEGIAVRFASEFVAMTTAAYVGGEVARAAWLAKKGEASGRALWLPYIEIVFDVFCANLIAFAAGAYALYAGGRSIAIVLLVLSSAILVLITAVVMVSRKGMIRVPRALLRPLRAIVGGKRAEELMAKGNAMMAEFCEASVMTLTGRNLRKIAIVALYTLLIAALTSSTLWLVAQGLSLDLSFAESALLVYSSIVLGNLPVTLGGSGLAEAGVYLYSDQVFGLASWPMVFSWRIISYHVPLVITGGSALLVLNRYTNSPSGQAQAQP